MSAAEEHENAQQTLSDAQAKLAEVQARLDQGDPKVTGTDLASVKADVEAATLRARGAEARAAEERTAQDAAARIARIDQAKAEHVVTSKKLAAAIATARESNRAVLVAAEEHAAATAANLSGVGRQDLRLPAPRPEEVLTGVQVLALQDAGQRVDLTYPHIALEPLLPFLPAEG